MNFTTKEKQSLDRWPWERQRWLQGIIIGLERLLSQCKGHCTGCKQRCSKAK